jgi:hypothetical protein
MDTVMNRQSALLILGMFLFACEPVPVQFPPGSTQPPNVTPSSPPTAQATPPVTGSQRWQHAWTKAVEGAFMGLNLGGPFGGAGGLALGLLTGLITADSHFGDLNNQIQTEQQKDQQLESAIDQELQNQRTLENQLAGVASDAGSAGADKPEATKGNQSQARPGGNSPLPKPQNNIELASINKPAVPTAPAVPFKNMEVKDMNGDGVPDLWIYYNPQRPSEILRQEESTRSAGTVDTWSYFREGKLVRREVDTKGSGRPDTIYYYDGDKIAREERDENGRGTMSYRASYQDGRLAKVEKDSDGQGRMNIWIYFDTSEESEIVLKEERDLNGDGIPDLWSYYNHGKLVRRDISAIGLELLAQQEQLPVANNEIKLVSTPGN